MVHIKQSFLVKYPYHKVPDRKHTGRQWNLKAVTLSDASRRLDIELTKYDSGVFNICLLI